MSTISKGSNHFGVLTYTGDGSASRTIVDTNAVSFQPDFVWVKGRSGATDHALYDAVRGTTKDLVSNSTAAETTQSTGLTGFVNGGFTVGNLAKMNTSGATYVAWCWKANGAGSSNTSGSITSTVSVNTTAGFSVVTFTSQASGTGTVGHGLGIKPSLIITKLRTLSANWRSYHSSLGATKDVRLNLTDAALTTNTSWADTEPTSTVFTVGSSFAGSYTTVAYCWAEIAGYSKFGSYTGNGSADGPFIYLGFRPKFIMVKRSSTTGDWFILDTSRDSFNAEFRFLYPNLSNAEETSSVGLDGVSNGFKIRNTFANINASGSTYIYMAFAENPFKNANAR
jgi:hypothetical protein